METGSMVNKSTAGQTGDATGPGGRPEPAAAPGEESRPLQLALPKGRMQGGVLTLLSEAGMKVKTFDRGCSPSMVLRNLLVKRSEGEPPLLLRRGARASPSSKKTTAGAIILAIS